MPGIAGSPERTIIGYKRWCGHTSASAADALLGRTLTHTTIAQLARDELTWGRKEYLSRPMPGAGDGLIGKYRAWARQFYPEGFGTE